MRDAILPASYAGRWIRLRPVARSDHPQLFAVIRHAAGGEPGGFVDATIRERHEVAEFECYIEKQWRPRGAVTAIARLIRHLFVNWPIRKLYCQTFAYNEDSTRILARIGFHEVGRFREFVWRVDR